MEFEGLAVIWLHTLGTRSPTFGWSGNWLRNLSSFSLNSGTETFFMFLRLAGRQLNSLGPLTWKLWFLKDWYFCFPLSWGIEHSLPRLSLTVSVKSWRENIKILLIRLWWLFHCAAIMSSLQWGRVYHSPLIVSNLFSKYPRELLFCHCRYTYGIIFRLFCIIYIRGNCWQILALYGMGLWG